MEINSPLLLALKSLLKEIAAVKLSHDIFDEWTDTDTCSILQDMESTLLSPLFNQFEELREQLELMDQNSFQQFHKVKIGSPEREITRDEYGNQYVRYFFTPDHLEELEEEVRKVIEVFA